MRISNEEFQRKPLFVHEFLADVPLHDVWAIRLRGGGKGRTLNDLQRVVPFEAAENSNFLVSALFRLRWTLGRVFGWDKKHEGVHPASYIHRLKPEDRAHSSAVDKDPFTYVYAFENEALREIINGTVHAFLHLSLEPAGDDYMLYLAIYVKRVNAFTPFYMTLIDPFRHIIVYPSMISKIQRTWETAYA